jgi:hypothetical protein
MVAIGVLLGAGGGTPGSAGRLRKGHWKRRSETWG